MQETVGNKTYGEREPESQLGEEQNSERPTAGQHSSGPIGFVNTRNCRLAAGDRAPPTAGWQDVCPPSWKELIEIAGEVSPETFSKHLVDRLARRTGDLSGLYPAFAQ